MKTWLFTWNQEKWDWTGLYGYEELIEDIDQVGYAFSKWTCGTTKSISVGDRIFLVKLGSNPKGIVASGYAATEVFEGTHWDEDKKKAGKRARRIVIKLDKIKNYKSEAILPFDVLREIGPNYHWSTQSSGVSIPDDVAAQLETVWSTY